MYFLHFSLSGTFRDNFAYLSDAAVTLKSG